MSTNPRVLIVTPEVAYLPAGMGENSKGLNARAGGLADVSAALINALYCQGADIHVALPHYRTIFNSHFPLLVKNQRETIQNSVPVERIHLAQDRVFFYLNRIYSGDALENIKISLAFQREVINNIVPDVVSRYWDQYLEIVFVADGEYQPIFHEIVRFHNLSHRVAVCGFNEQLSRRAYGASDFVFMPSSFEPCGLPQMIGPIYGALPVAHDTGGIHDTVEHLDGEKETGNGFLFETFDTGGLFWAIDQAMQFYLLPLKKRARQVKRIMQQSAITFNHRVTAQRYIDLYEKMLQRPLIQPENLEIRAVAKNRTKKGEIDSRFQNVP